MSPRRTLKRIDKPHYWKDEKTGIWKCRWLDFTHPCVVGFTWQEAKRNYDYWLKHVSATG